MEAGRRRGGVEQILAFTAARLVGLSLDGTRLLAEGYLVIRNATEMAAFDLRMTR